MSDVLIHHDSIVDMVPIFSKHLLKKERKILKIRID